MKEEKMSIKLYDGLMTRSTSLYDINAMLLALKPSLKKVAANDYRKLFAKTLVEFSYSVKYDVNITSYDIVPTEWKAEEKSAMVFIALALRKAAQKTANATLLSDCWVDLDFNVSVSLLPLPDKTLMIPFSQNQRLISVLSDAEGIEKYGYWNNTDPEEEVSSKSWETRKREWNAVLPGIGIPAENGPTLRLLSYQEVVGLPEPEAVLPLISDEMLTAAARWAAINKLWKEEEGGKFFDFEKKNAERIKSLAKDLFLSKESVCSVLEIGGKNAEGNKGF